MKIICGAANRIPYILYIYIFNRFNESTHTTRNLILFYSIRIFQILFSTLMKNHFLWASGFSFFLCEKYIYIYVCIFVFVSSLCCSNFSTKYKSHYFMLNWPSLFCHSFFFRRIASFFFHHANVVAAVVVVVVVVADVAVSIICIPQNMDNIE